jgi:hypothetical protein
MVRRGSTSGAARAPGSVSFDVGSTVIVFKELYSARKPLGSKRLSARRSTIRRPGQNLPEWTRQVELPRRHALEFISYG